MLFSLSLVSLLHGFSAIQVWPGAETQSFPRTIGLHSARNTVTFGSTFGSMISYSPGIQQFQCTKLRYIDTSSLITDLAFRLAFIVP